MLDPDVDDSAPRQTVDNILLGGPAYNSQHGRSGAREGIPWSHAFDMLYPTRTNCLPFPGVQKGDRITHVDGKVNLLSMTDNGYAMHSPESILLPGGQR
eukprot:3799628-Rhodomonas_salina.2